MAVKCIFMALYVLHFVCCFHHDLIEMCVCVYHLSFVVFLFFVDSCTAHLCILDAFKRSEHACHFFSFLKVLENVSVRINKSVTTCGENRYHFTGDHFIDFTGNWWQSDENTTSNSICTLACAMWNFKLIACNWTRYTKPQEKIKMSIIKLNYFNKFHNKWMWSKTKIAREFS